MATRKLATITPEEFDRRLDVSNERLRRDLAEAQERVQKLEALILRKEAFAHRLEQMLAEIEREEGEIATLEMGLRAPRNSSQRLSTPPQKQR